METFPGSQGPKLLRVVRAVLAACLPSEEKDWQRLSRDFRPVEPAEYVGPHYNDPEQLIAMRQRLAAIDSRHNS
jgi:hypothetical protein